MNNFTPFASLLGGVLIGVASLLLLAGAGRIAGISGIAGGLFSNPIGDRRWRVAFVGAMVATGFLIRAFFPGAIVVDIAGGWARFVVGGLLVGVGTQLGSGCTSGHGVCGVGRGSPRSIGATLTFVAVGMLTVFLLRGAWS